MMIAAGSSLRNVDSGRDVTMAALVLLKSLKKELSVSTHRDGRI